MRPLPPSKVPIWHALLPQDDSSRKIGLGENAVLWPLSRGRCYRQRAEESKFGCFFNAAGARTVSLLVVAVSLAACTHDRSGDIRKHYAEFRWRRPMAMRWRSATPIPAG